MLHCIASPANRESSEVNPRIFLREAESKDSTTMASIHPESPGVGAMGRIADNGEYMLVVQEVDDGQHAVGEEPDANNPSEHAAKGKVDPTVDEGQAVDDTPSTPDPRSYDQARTPHRYSKRQCKVQQAEFRAMALLHLNELYEFAAEELSVLHLVDRNPHSSTHEKRVTKDLLNLYHLDHFFVRPLTFQFKCSFMEISSPSEQRPLHFVSHAWSTALCDTLSMLNWHNKCHNLTASTSFYW